VVSTSYAVKALLLLSEAFDISYDDTVESAATFLFDHLDYTEADGRVRIKYRVDDTGDWYTINTNALGAHMLLDLYEA
jgi:hypothetical protein